MREDESKSRAFARDLRKNMTRAEVILWSMLRRKETGWRFRRQHPIGPYIADFACVAAKLVVEIDGVTHGSAAKPHDDARTRYLERAGWRVLRVGNTDVYRELEGVWRKIVEVLGPPPPPPCASRVPFPQPGEETGDYE